MSFSFEKLRVWQDSLDLSENINQLTKRFPIEERFGLSSQIQRAADSVSLNIAEGSTGQSKAEFRRFLGIAIRSGIEVVACLYLAQKRRLITEDIFNSCYFSTEQLIIKIQSLRNSLKE